MCGATRLLQDIDTHLLTSLFLYLRFLLHAWDTPVQVCAGNSLCQSPKEIQTTSQTWSWHRRCVRSGLCPNINVSLGSLPDSRLRSTPIKYLITLNINDKTSALPLPQTVYSRESTRSQWENSHAVQIKYAGKCARFRGECTFFSKLSLICSDARQTERMEWRKR